jgi:putative toxin-antitoxin system antitoxin component (TIGR02293 family)
MVFYSMLSYNEIETKDVYLSDICQEPQKAMKTRKKAIRPGAAVLFRIQFDSGNVKELDSREKMGHFIREIAKAKNFVELNQIIGEEGLPYKSIKPLAQYLKLSQEQLSQLLGCSPRTLSRWSDDHPIGALGSKLMIDLDELVAHGFEILGDAEALSMWLQQSNQALGDHTPISLATTPYGISLVKDAMNALEYGNVM